METNIEIVRGPLTSKVSRQEAEDTLRKNPNFPKNASYELSEVEGYWVAAIAAPKVAAPPAFLEGGGGDSADEEPGSDTSEAKPEGSPTDDAGEEGPPTDDGEGGEKKDKKGEGGEIKQALGILHAIADALGIPVPGAEGPLGDSPVPGPDDPTAGPPGPPPGAAAPPAPHEHPLKPGEAPPGTTPLGAPAFSSVPNDHPWKEVIGKKRSWTVEAEDDRPLGTVASELKGLAEPYGYRVYQLQESRNSAGRRTAKALITK